jgi:tetratricopeptide (TPR) repeat protein
MPSLQQLNEFKSSFRDIGNEAATLDKQHVPHNDLPLPDSEPVSPSSSDVPSDGDPLSGLNLDGLGDFPSEDSFPEDPSSVDLPEGDSSPGDSFPEDSFSGGLPPGDSFPEDLSPEDLSSDMPSADNSGENFPEEEASGSNIMDDFAFNEFLNTMPEDLPPPPDPEAPYKAASAEEAADETAPPEEAGPPDDGVEAEAGGEPPGDAFPDDASFNLDNSPSEEKFSADLDFEGADIFPTDEETPANEDSLEENVFSDEAFQVPFSDLNSELDGAPPDAGSEGGESEESPAPDLNFSQDDEFSLPDDGSAADTGSADSFDRFNLDDDDTGNIKDEGSGQGNQEAQRAGEGLSNFDDFSLSGIDDIFDQAAAAAAIGAESSPAGDQTGRKSSAAEVPPAPKKVEDIVLSAEDLARFQETLARYPLNLRIACEEIIADHGAPVEQMDALIKTITKGGTPKETASQASKILNRYIPIPKGYEKKTGEAMEIEQESLSYVFSRKFLPVLRIFLIVALLGASLVYLAWQFIYIPILSDSIYRRGYERIAAGEYERANERFSEAFALHRVKKWFYQYAEAFRDERQYIYAEEKYDELLRYYPQDKKGALDYARMETDYLRNYSKADRIIRMNILDYNVDDMDGLLALGDNNLAWGEIDPSRYENARQAYARLLEQYGWQDHIVQRMLLYFIRIDNLGEVVSLQGYLLGDPKKKVSPGILSELGGYLLNKQLEEVQGVPDANLERIEGVRDLLIKASQGDPSLPEPRYHLARYYDRFGNTEEERKTLESAVKAFDAAREESPRRTGYRIDAERRYAKALTNVREFFAAEERLIKGIGVYEDALNRRLLSRSPEYGRLYADLGDIEYFTKSRDMNLALDYYHQAELNGWAPPEIEYRMGSAHYHLRQWGEALDRFFSASSELPLNRRLLHALGNASYLRGNYHNAEGYYSRLLDLLEAEHSRFPMLSPNERQDHMELAERIMVTRNNMGVVKEALASRTGNPRYRAEAMALYAESSRAWDALTRNPETMVRSNGINLGFLNNRNLSYPQADYDPQLFNQIDKDVLEPSAWETIAPPDYRLSD